MDTEPQGYQRRESSPPKDPRVEKLMHTVSESLALPQDDPKREELQLKLMADIEAARDNGEITAATIGEGHDRAVIFEHPTKVTLTEPAHVTDSGSDKIGFKIGEMTTVRNRYLAVNRKGFVGFDIAGDQTIDIDPNSPAIQDRSRNGGFSIDQFKNWFNDNKRYVQGLALDGQRTVNQIMELKNYPSSPYTDEAGHDSKISKAAHTVKPDAIWETLLTFDDNSVDQERIRTNGMGGRWFDTFQDGYMSIRVNNPQTVESVLKESIKPSGPVPSQGNIPTSTPSNL